MNLQIRCKTGQYPQGNDQLHSLDKTHLHFYGQASLTLLSVFCFFFPATYRVVEFKDNKRYIESDNPEE